jgi:hypothetical protein
MDKSRNSLSRLGLHSQIYLYGDISIYRFWNLKPCSPVDAHRHFEETYYFYLQGPKQEAGGKQEEMIRRMILVKHRPCRSWLPTAAARVRVRAACGVCGGQSGTGAGFLRVLRFPLPIIIPPISTSS